MNQKLEWLLRSPQSKKKLKKKNFESVWYNWIETSIKEEVNEDDDKCIGEVFEAIGLEKAKVFKNFRLKSKDKARPLVFEIEDSSYKK